jgi:putative ABC transport system permease protein
MAGPINWLSQVASVTMFGLLGIPRRLGSVLSAIIGIMGVVAVLVGVLSMAQGFRAVMANSASPDSVIVLRAGADTEMVSGLSKEQTRIIADAPGLARSPLGSVSSAELSVIINLPKRSTGTDANVPLRGVEPGAVGVRDGFKIVSGRLFERGKNELMVGAGAAREFAGLELGGKLKVGKYEWPVVGIFTCNGGSAESEVWTDAPVLQAAYERGDSYQAVYARLQSPDSFNQFKDALTTDPRMNVKVLRQSEFFAEQSTMITRLITTLGVLIALLMAIGAVFAALNTMYSSVSARTREIATLRALGFGSAAVVVSVMLESLVLALLGGAVGAGVAFVVFNGFHTTTMNWQSFSQVTFAFQVTPLLLGQGIALACIIGLFGGILPALRAARMPIASALREL